VSGPPFLAGLPAAPGVAIGRAVCLAPHRAAVPRYLLAPGQVDAEILRWSTAREAAVRDLQRLRAGIDDASSELAALLEVHLLLLQDAVADAAIREHIQQHRHNAEWALLARTEEATRELDAAEDAYLRERKADLEQVSEHLLRILMSARLPDADGRGPAPVLAGLAPPAGTRDELIVVAHDLSPADLLQLKKDGFAGCVTEVGGITGHTAIVARSVGIPAVVGVRAVRAVVQPGDLLVLDGQAGRVWVRPGAAHVASYRRKQQRWQSDRQSLLQLKDTPARTVDGHAVDLLANVEQPLDSDAARAAGAAGIGLFRTEFLFMGRAGRLPGEDEQFAAYQQAVLAMDGAPVTIRSADIGADKPLDGMDGSSQNPALGLRAIRWSLSEPEIFLTQLRAILRAALDGDVRLLVPMITHASQIRETLALVARARRQLQARGLDVPSIPVGAMIEVPAAALTAPVFLRHFDFLSIGTNDLIQYTLAVDRTDASLATLYDPLHPAVLGLLAQTIAAANAAGKEVSVCGEMAGNPRFTRLLLGLGLRSFSMEPGQIPRVKREILQASAAAWADRARRVVHHDDPAGLLRALNQGSGARASDIAPCTYGGQ